MRSSVLNITMVVLHCVLDIPVEISGRQLADVRAEDING